MARDVKIAGATYEAVPAVELGTPNGGTAVFPDTSGDTVAPETLAAGVTAHDASGNLIVGTNGGLNVTPVGTVIYYAGKAAPAGYLACDGTVYSVADYPALAAFFAENYGANNYWGGNGSTTFAVPDWQGEFFRAAGTNSRENQGSGAAVGVHQDATVEPNWFANTYGVGNAFFRQGESQNMVSNMDFAYANTYNLLEVTGTSRPGGNAYPERYTSRPTNTALLVCIKAT